MKKENEAKYQDYKTHDPLKISRLNIGITLTGFDDTNPNPSKTRKETITPKLTNEQLYKLAKDIVDKKIFTSFNIAEYHRKDFITKVFFVLVYIDWNKFTKDDFSDVGMIYESYSEGIKHLSTAGYPMFYSCRFLHKDYVPVLSNLIDLMTEETISKEKDFKSMALDFLNQNLDKN